MFRMQTNASCFLFAITFVLATATQGFSLQDPTIQIAIDTEEIFVGESFTLQAVVEGVESTEPPDVSQLDGDFSVQFETEQSMNATSMVVQNGRMTTRKELKTLYQYRVTPRKSGRLTIPAVTIPFEGKLISSQSREINVLEPEPQEYVIVEVSSDRDKVYPTQTFQVNLKILVRELPDNNQDPLIPIRRNPPNISIPWIEEIDGLRSLEDKGRWLQNLLSDQGYGFSINDFSSRSGFLFDGPRVALFDLVRGKETRKLENGEEAQFFRYELSQTFTAVRPGTYSFGPATVRGTFVVDSRGREYRGKKIAATTKPIEVQVSEVPSPRPSNFLGGVGKFTAKVDVSPRESRIGDPMTLTLEVTGQTADSLEQVYAPDLSQFELIAKDFEVMDRSPTGKVERNIKTFTYGIRPKNRLEEFPEIEFSSFDPDSEQFIPITTKSSPLKIEQGTALSSGELAGAQNAKPSTIKQDRSGIFQGTRDMYPFTNDAISLSVWTGVAGASWIVALAGAAWVRINRGRVKDTLAERLSQARSVSIEHIKNAKLALASGRTDEAIASVRQAIVGLIGAKRATDGRGLTTRDVLEVLESTTLTKQESSTVKDILDTIDSARYGRLSDTDTSSMIEQASSMMPTLYAALANSTTRNSSKRCSVLLMFVLSSVSMGMEQTPILESEFQNDFDTILSAMGKSQTKDEFVAVASRFEELESRGLKSGSLHFHCGNAWFQAGVYGNAIRQYRLAKSYLPRDTYLEANLQQAISAAPGKLENHNGEGIFENVFFWSRWLSYPFKIQASTVLFVLSAGLFAGYAIRGKNQWLLGSMLGLLIASVVLGEAVIRSPERYVTSYGVLNTQTTVRKGMGEEYAPAFDRPLLDGAEFEVLQRTRDWTLGRFPGIGDGWIKNENVAGP
ncbi:MAG: BatD family protein [Pirellula sp.]|nr:BatD family protein [Pirellula sp.]